MAFGGYNYGGYPAAGGYYAPPMPDQLAQLRGAQMPPMQQPMMGQPVQPMQTQQAQPAANGINWVQGEEGARAWLVNPNTTVMLMDSDGSSFYLKSADASGMPQPLRIFDYVERTQAPKTPVQGTQAPAVEYVTRADFNALAARADALARELEEIKNKKCRCDTKAVKEAAENA